jgi:uncharacterized membrane protein/glutaredoxin
MAYENNLEGIVEKLNLKVRKETIKKSFKLHPDYPSLSTLSDILSEWKVDNLAVKISPQQLQEVTFPAIAHCEDDREGYFVLLQSFENQKVNYWDSVKGAVTESIELFTSKWHGVTLLMEVTEKSGEPEYQENLKTERFGNLEKWIGFVTLGLVALGGFFIAETWQNALLWLVLLVGTTISTILLLGEYGIKNPTIEKLCNLSNQTNCDTVLASSASKLFGYFSWAEIGFCYFVGTCIFTLIAFLTHSFDALNTLTILSLIALPYTIFSVYYQWQIVKKWCTLCLGVQGILVAQFVVLIMNNKLAVASFSSAYLLIISLLVPTAIWFLVKPSLEKAKTIPDLERSVMTYKYNSSLFNTLLEKQRSVATGHSPLILGNPDAPVLITMVSNPFCGPCAKAHEVLENLLGSYHDYIKVELILTGNTNSKEVIKHVMSLGKEQVHDALNDWYKMVNYETWAAKYPIQITKVSDNQAVFFEEWSKEAQITHTPTIFVNGQELVMPYTLKDLKYHIKELAEEVETQEV